MKVMARENDDDHDATRSPESLERWTVDGKQKNTETLAHGVMKRRCSLNRTTTQVNSIEENQTMSSN